MNVFEWRAAPRGDYAVIGDPISHSLSPLIHAAAYQSHGLEYRYHAIRVPLEEFADALAHLANIGYKGLNVTVPLKEAAFEWCQSFEAESEQFRSINTLRLADRRGLNTDAPAFISTLKSVGIEPPARLLILGAGGTARALLKACDGAGYELCGWNRTKGRLIALADQLNVSMEIRDDLDPSGCRAMINLTSASLHGEPLPVHWDWADSDLLAYDVAYGAELSPFLLRGKRHGLQVIDGIPMLIEQAALAFEWWAGLPAPRRDMIRAVHEHLEPDA